MRAWLVLREEALAATQAAAPDTCLAILATCRTVLLEAFHIWYKHNTFNFSRAGDLTSFLLSIGRVRANEIRSIRLDLPEQDWDDVKALYAIGRLLRLETLIFVYNGLVSPFHTNPMCLSFPKIISHLRGLRDVRFVDPEDPRSNSYGWKQGMSECVKVRMDELKRIMMAPRKKSRKAPPMMDLFGKLRLKDQSKNDLKRWHWEEGLSYAPDVGGDEQRALQGPRSIVEQRKSSQGEHLESN